MVIERPYLPFWQWLLGGGGETSVLLYFVGATVLVIVLALVLGYLFTAMKYGPGEAFFLVSRIVGSAASDLLRISPRRVGAMTRLAVHESLRRYVLIGFAIFAVVMMFAGWFLDVKTDHPARIYLSFVIPWSGFLTLVLALALSSFSIPSDIKNKTIFTVMTKPVVAWELVLGRILGFCLVGSVMLAAMCGVSYVFVVRGLSHAHSISDADVTPIYDEKSASREPIAYEADTSYDSYHQHPVRLTHVDGEWIGFTERVSDHRHRVRRIEKGGETRYQIGGPEEMLLARQPLYGTLKFRSRTGEIVERGISVGDEWTYRSYIEGRTPAAAIFSFSNLDESEFPENQLPLEMNLEIFRTHKGFDDEIDEEPPPIRGTIILANPNPASRLQTKPIPFNATDSATMAPVLSRRQSAINPDGTTREIDIFRDLVEDGELEVIIQCDASQQYFGFAQYDVYLRASDGSFLINFVKSYVSLWLQMALIVTFGVFFSTSVSGPVAMLATVGTFVMGRNTQFVLDLSNRQIQGGGPLEAMWRLVRQDNLVQELEAGPLTPAIKWFDSIALFLMEAVARALPDYRDFDTARYVADGFLIELNVIAQHTLTTVAYVAVLTCLGYLILKTRELAG